MLKDLTTMELASRLVEIATGEPYGDGYVVTNIIVGYADSDAAPYGAGEDAVIVLGDWNTKRYARGDDAPLTKDETMPARLARALERAGVQCEWLDEWTRCDECYRAIRTKPTSYGWIPQYAWIGDDIVCRECLLSDIGGAVDAGDYVNNPRNAITWCSDAELEAAGWTQWAPGNPREYENGWHPGQDDDPRDVLAEILANDPDAEVLFLISDVGQFDLRFVAMTRDRDEDDTNE